MTLLHSILVTFFTSMIPVLELRGAIPIGVAGGLPPLLAMVIAILGNLVPVPFIILFIKRIFAWLKNRPRIRPLVEKLERRAEGKMDTVQRYAWWGLCILVAIPLPGTGAWTGALVAALMDMRLKKAFPAVVLGVVIAGVIITVLSYGALHLLN